MTLAPSRTAVRYADTAAGRIAWRSDGDGPPLLLFQRFRGTIDDWDPVFVEALIARGRRVIRFDSAGIGRSGGTTPTHVPQWADVGLMLMDALDLGTCDILGWSMGGMVVQSLALKAPARVRRLVIAASSPGAITEVPPDLKAGEIRAHAVNTEEDFLYLFFAHDAAGREAGKASLARVASQSEGPAVNATAYRAQLAAAQAFNTGPDSVRTRLGELTMPILVANGQQDVMQPPFGTYVIAHAAPDARAILYPRAGHAFLFQYPDDFADEVVRFLGTR